jgi:hypothetical protein
LGRSFFTSAAVWLRPPSKPHSRAPPKHLGGGQGRLAFEQQSESLDHGVVGFRWATVPTLAELPALQIGEARYRLGENSLYRATSYAALDGYFALKNACFRQVVDLAAGHNVDHAKESPG